MTHYQRNSELALEAKCMADYKIQRRAAYHNRRLNHTTIAQEKDIIRIKLNKLQEKNLFSFFWDIDESHS